MKVRSRSLVAALALIGLGLTATAQPAAAFFGSFAASCHGGDTYMTAPCRRIDGSWNYTTISSCCGAGVCNADGFLVCGTE